MFSFDLQDDGSYIIHLLDGSQLHVQSDDTPHLRRELAKLALRIEAREFAIHHKNYLPEWWKKPDNLSVDQINNLIEVYEHIFPEKEEWQLLDKYETDVDKKISLLEREVLHHKKIIEGLKKEIDEEKNTKKGAKS